MATAPSCVSASHCDSAVLGSYRNCGREKSRAAGWKDQNRHYFSLLIAVAAEYCNLETRNNGVL